MESGGVGDSGRLEEMEAKLAEVQKAKDEADAVAAALDKKAAAESAYRAHARKLGPVFYIYPLFPAVLSMVTIFAGSVVANSTPNIACNQGTVKLYIFGNIVLSYILILFYTTLLVGIDVPMFFCRLRYTVRSFVAPTVFAIPYCLTGLVWNLLGTVWYMDHAGSCETDAPSLVSMMLTEVIFFWISFGAVTILLVQRWFYNKYADKLKRKREHNTRLKKLREEDEKIEFEEKQAELDRKAEEKEKAKTTAAKKEAAAKKKAEEDERRKKFGESSGEEEEDGSGDGEEEEEEEESDDDDEEESEDEEESDDE